MTSDPSPKESDGCAGFLLIAAGAVLVWGGFHAIGWIGGLYEAYPAQVIFVVAVPIALAMWLVERARRRIAANGLGAVLAKNARIAASSLGVTAAFVVVIQGVIDPSDMTIEALARVESRLSRMKTIVGAFALSGWASLLLLFGMLAVATWVTSVPPSEAGTGRLSVERGMARSRGILARYAKTTSAVYGVLALACSFSFFTSKVNGHCDRLRASLERSTQMISTCASRLEEEAQEAAEAQFIGLLQGETPGDFQRLAEAVAKRAASDARVHEIATSAARRWRVTLTVDESRHVADSNARISARRSLEHQLDLRRETASSRASREAGAVDTSKERWRRFSLHQLEDLDSSLKTLSQQRRGRYARLLEAPESRLMLNEVVGAAMKGATAELDAALKDFPLASAIVSIFKATAKDVLKQKAESLRVRVVEVLQQPNPPEVSRSIDLALAEGIEDSKRGATEAWVEWSRRGGIDVESMARRVEEQNTLAAGVIRDIEARCAPIARNTVAEMMGLLTRLERASAGLSARFPPRPDALSPREAQPLFRFEPFSLSKNPEVPSSSPGGPRRPRTSRTPDPAKAADSGTPQYFREDVTAYVDRLVRRFTSAEPTLDDLESLKRVVNEVEAGVAATDAPKSLAAIQLVAPVDVPRVRMYTLAEVLSLRELTPQPASFAELAREIADTGKVTSSGQVDAASRVDDWLREWKRFRFTFPKIEPPMRLRRGFRIR